MPVNSFFQHPWSVSIPNPPIAHLLPPKGLSSARSPPHAGVFRLQGPSGGESLMAETRRSQDVGWRYGEMVGTRKDHVKCNYCHRVVHGGITLFKKHFIGKKGGTGACTSAPEEVRETIRKHLSESQQRKLNRISTHTPDARDKRTDKIMTRRAMMELRTSGNVHTEIVFDSPLCLPSRELGIRKRKRRNSKVQKKLRSSEKDTMQSFYVSSLPQYMRAKKLRGTKERYTNAKEQKKLDTNVFESYLEYLWSKFSFVKRKSCAYLDCLWFSLYKKGPSQTKVLTWIKKKQIFSRKYVFVPIICWSHWSLLILCHFGESFLSKAKRPCMLLLDSLGKIEPMRLQPDIRRFVLDIYKSEGCEEEESISNIPLLVPKVPQQRDGEECGIFVLYFIHLFLQSAPETFNQDGYPYFLTENWFSWEDMEIFHKEVLHFASDKYSTKCSDGNSR